MCCHNTFQSILFFFQSILLCLSVKACTEQQNWTEFNSQFSSIASKECTKQMSWTELTWDASSVALHQLYTVNGLTIQFILHSLQSELSLFHFVLYVPIVPSLSDCVCIHRCVGDATSDGAVLLCRGGSTGRLCLGSLHCTGTTQVTAYPYHLVLHTR